VIGITHAAASATRVHRYNARGDIPRGLRLDDRLSWDALEKKPPEAAATANMSGGTQAPGGTGAADMRRAPDRRRRVLYSLLHGSFNPRRRGPRRSGVASLRDLDWHHPQWLAVAVLIVVLSCVDAGLTLALMQHGAYEVNPLMAPLVGGSTLAFTLIKVGLTAGGVVLLTLTARMRAFGRLPVSFLLYAVLAGYGTLVVYEFRLLEETLLTF